MKDIVFAVAALSAAAWTIYTIVMALGFANEMSEVLRPMAWMFGSLLVMKFTQTKTQKVKQDV